MIGGRRTVGGGATVVRARAGAAVLIVLSLIIMAGCGDKIAEKAAEKVIESGSGAKVDIKDDGNSVSVTGEDGSTFQFGEDVEIPADFPDIPLPDDVRTVGMIVSEEEGGKGYAANFLTNMELSDLFKLLVSGLEDRGYTIEQQMEFDGSADAGFSIMATNADLEVSLFGGAGAGESEDGNGLNVWIVPRQ